MDYEFRPIFQLLVDSRVIVLCYIAILYLCNYFILYFYILYFRNYFILYFIFLQLFYFTAICIIYNERVIARALILK